MKELFALKAGGEGPRIFLICVHRNEALLLPHFISYYRSVGVTDFLMVDNASSDGSLQFLSGQSGINLKVYGAEGSYKSANFGMDWVNELLRSQCLGEYCIVVDADEILVWDAPSGAKLQELVKQMEQTDANVLPAHLIDMYPGSINDRYRVGEPFSSHSPYFDAVNPEFYHEWGVIYGRFTHKAGGVRKRVFGATVCIHKFPLIKYDFPRLAMGAGCHYFSAAGTTVTEAPEIRLFEQYGALMHFKFLKPHLKKVISERVREDQDWDGTMEYRKYLELFDREPTVSLLDEK